MAALDQLKIPTAMQAVASRSARSGAGPATRSPKPGPARARCCGPSWFLDVLTSPPPGGVRSDPGPDGRGLTTLCTLVADLTAGEAVIAARGEPPVAIPLADLAEGDPRARVQF